MFGGNQKEQRPTGRRHGTNETTSTDGIPSYYTADAAAERRVTEESRNKNIENMSNGPSFLDHIGENERNAEGPQRRSQKSGQQLNVFDWNDGKGSNQQQEPAHRGKRIHARDMDQQAQARAGPSAEANRTNEASKFENASNSAFLNFGKNKQ